MQPGNADPQAGLSLVETLMALVISSILVLGIGALIHSVSTAFGRAHEALLLERTLVDLKKPVRSIIAGSLLGHSEVRVVNSENGLSLQSADLAKTLVEVSVVDSHLLVVTGPSAIQIDISMFAIGRIEYFAAGDRTWVPSDDIAETDAIAAVRLYLSAGALSYPVVLWKRSELPAS